jgi:hypothetical protein
MRKGCALGATAFASFLRTTIQPSLPIGSFFVKMVFDVPVLKILSFVDWYDLLLALIITIM